MQLSQNIKPISYLKSKTAEVIHTVTQKRQSIIVTQNGEAKAVIQDIKSYEETHNTIALLKMIAQSKAAYSAGNYKPAKKAFSDIRKSIMETKS